MQAWDGIVSRTNRRGIFSRDNYVKWCVVLAGVVVVAWVISIFFRPALPSPNHSLSEAKWKDLVVEDGFFTGETESNTDAGLTMEEPVGDETLFTLTDGGNGSSPYGANATAAGAVENGTKYFTVVGGETLGDEAEVEDGNVTEAAEATAAANVTNATVAPVAEQNVEKTWTQRMIVPASVATKEDQYFCTSIPLPHENQTIGGFVPRADVDFVHHMILQTCKEEPRPKNGIHVTTSDGEMREVWDCREEPVCPSEEGWSEQGQILYAWAMGATDFDAGEDSGFVVGSRVGLGSPYIVLQTHFLKDASLAADARDHAGEVEIRFREGYPRNVLSVDLLQNSRFALRPNRTDETVEAKCCRPGPRSAELFAYRVHAHEYATNISLKVAGRPAATGDPQLPHFFKMAEPGTKLRFGADWTATCEYNTTTTDLPVFAGQGHNNEMCNMYVMISSHVPYPGVCWGELGISAEQHPSCAIPENATAAGYLHTMGSLGTPDLGQVAGVHVGYGGDASKVLIFHRAGRVMEAFDHADKIEEDVFVVWNAADGKVERSFGAGMFSLPHGLTVDRDGDLWCTDVDAQQAYRLSEDGDLQLVVGIENERSHDLGGLCRPTEVAVSNYGHFFVADGYCNSRVVRFDEFGDPVAELELPGAVVAHSIILDDCLNTLLVADRENGRIRVVDAYDGTEQPNVDLSSFGKVYSLTQDEYGNVYALLWDRDVTGRTTLVQLRESGRTRRANSFTLYDSVSLELPGIFYPHDFAVSYNFGRNALDVYVGETGPGATGRVTWFQLDLGASA